MSALHSVAARATLVLLFVLAALAGTAAGVLFASSADLPEVSALDSYAPSTITRILDRSGAPLGDFAVERRVVVRYDDIPAHLRQAILAAEDAGFFDHSGLSVSRMLLALVRDITTRGNVPGGSTLTQQLARNLFPGTIGFDRTWERKIKEALVAIQIEKRYTKPEIFTLYCNQIYFGHGAYGVESASQLYFGKRVQDLTLEEAALIAGIIQANVRQSPYVNPEAARRRRNYALDRMATERFITAAEAETAKALPITVADGPDATTTVAPYFLEEIRKRLEDTYGATALYAQGLTVRTGLDRQLQVAANRAIDRALRRLDRKRGVYRPATQSLQTIRKTLDTYRPDRWSQPLAPGDIVPGVVTAVSSMSATVKVGPLTGQLTRQGVAWTRRTDLTTLVHEGDIIEVSLTTVDDQHDTAVLGLEQPPAIEGALVAIDNHTGDIRALVGGFSFTRSKFNRATQAARQMGSTVKPLLYTAAIDRGLTATTMLDDTPASFDAGEGQPMYTPSNYDREFVGPLTLRAALEQSRNIPAVKLIDLLGPAQVAAHAARFGFREPFRPFLSMALGAQETTLLEVTSAYSAFPNAGVRMPPVFIRSVDDRRGARLEETRPTPSEAIRADTAAVMTALLQGVMQRGTGAASASLRWPLGGKTGTVDDYTDAWFIGFDPDITVGVWFGRDEKKPIGPNETGTTAALPAWIEFMRDYLSLRGPTDTPPAFPRPSSVVTTLVNRDTGLPTSPDDPRAINEWFLSGTEPATGTAPATRP
jgi:penicillin-binding protein 1A